VNSAIDLSPSRNHNTLALGICMLLLGARLLLLNQGAVTMWLLGIMYVSILFISRRALTGTTIHRASVPLAVGVLSVVLVRLLLAAPVQSRATGAGIVISLLAAVAEEALFRGAVFARLEPLGRDLAIVASATAFALVHVPFYGLRALPIDFGAGVLFGWQRRDSGSWTVPAATHAFANLLAVLP
jgi:membrane protease YdiL (CAAX protease family)